MAGGQLEAAIMALLMLATDPAAAESQSYQGIVESVDPRSDTVVFADGTTFRAAEGVQVDGLKPGTRVVFYYHTYGGQKTVVSYEYTATGDVDGAAPLSILPAAGQ